MGGIELTPVQLTELKPELLVKSRKLVKAAVEARQLDAPLHLDKKQLSQELVEEFGRTGGSGNVDQLLEGLGQNFMNQKLGTVEECKNSQKKVQKSETLIDWTPRIEKGQVTSDSTVLGEVSVRERTHGGPDDIQSLGQVRGGMAKGLKAARALESREQSNSDRATASDFVSLSAESQQMAKKFTSRGISVPGVNRPSAHQPGGPKPAGERILHQGPVVGQGGPSQTLEVEPQGRLSDHSFLRQERQLV
ncbi:MAG: hypothetical protein U0931_14175 [Vulcanimicrobiota bacterium]